MNLHIVIILLLAPTLIYGLSFTNVQTNTCPGGGMSFDIIDNTGAVTIDWVPGGALGNSVTGLNPGVYTIYATDSLTTVDYVLTIAGSQPILDPNWDTYSVGWDPIFATPHLGMYVDRTLDDDVVTSNVTSVIQGFGGSVSSQMWSSPGGIFDFPSSPNPLFFPYGDTAITTLYLTTVTMGGCTEVFNVTYGVNRVRPVVTVLRNPNIGMTNSQVMFDFVPTISSVSQQMNLVVFANQSGTYYSFGNGMLGSDYPRISSDLLPAGSYMWIYYYPSPYHTGFRYLYFDIVEQLSLRVRTYTHPGQNPIVSLDGTGPYTYSWTGGPMVDPSRADPGFLATSPTVYLVDVTDALGRMGSGQTTFYTGSVSLRSSNPNICGQYELEGSHEGGLEPVNLVWSPRSAIKFSNRTHAVTKLTTNTTIYYALTDDQGLVVTATFDAIYKPPILEFSYSADGCYLLNVSLGDQILIDNHTLAPGQSVVVVETQCGNMTANINSAPYTCGYNYSSEPVPVTVGSLTPTITTFDQEPLTLSLVTLSEVIITPARTVTDLVGYTVVSTLDLEGLPWYVYVENYTCYDLVISTAFYDSRGHNVTLRRYFPTQDICELDTQPVVVLNRNDVKYAFDVEAWPFTRQDSLLILSTTYVFNGTKVTTPRVQALNESLLYRLDTASGAQVTISHLTYAQVDDDLGNVTVILVNNTENATVVAHIVFPHFNRSLSYDPVLSLLLASSYKKYSYTYMGFTAGALAIAAIVVGVVMLISLSEAGRRMVYGAEGYRIKRLRKHMEDNDITPESDNVRGDLESGG